MAKKHITLSRTIKCYYHNSKFYREPINIHPLKHIEVFSVLASRGNERAMHHLAKLLLRTGGSGSNECLMFCQNEIDTWVNCVQDLTSNVAYQRVILTASISILKEDADILIKECGSQIDLFLIIHDKIYLYKKWYQIKKEFIEDKDGLHLSSSANNISYEINRK